MRSENASEHGRYENRGEPGEAGTRCEWREERKRQPERAWCGVGNPGWNALALMYLR